MYIIVRSDLPPGLMMAQACHVAIEAQRNWDLPEEHHLIILDGGSLEDIKALCSSRWWDLWFDLGTKFILFREPDLDNEITAVALPEKFIPKGINKLPLLWKGVN